MYSQSLEVRNRKDLSISNLSSAVLVSFSSKSAEALGPVKTVQWGQEFKYFISIEKEDVGGCGMPCILPPFFPGGFEAIPIHFLPKSDNNSVGHPSLGTSHSWMPWKLSMGDASPAIFCSLHLDQSIIRTLSFLDVNLSPD